MASYVPPEKNAAFVFYVSLESQAAPGTFQANPTLAAGDVKVATDDGAPANLGTLPAVDADFTKRVKVSLSAAEMNGDNVTVIFSDAAGAEWYDLTVNLQTATNQIDDLATAAALAALNNLSAAQVNAEVDTALADIHLDHLLAADYDPASKPGVATALLNELIENDGGVSRYTANALEQGPGATADEIVDALEAALAAVSSVTVVATVSGATATVYQYATWDATFTLSGTPGLTAYENLIFAVKRFASDTDAESVLYVNSATGLLYIGQAAATGASYGSLTANSATEFTVYVDAAEVVAKIAANFGGSLTWTLKGVETGTTPDEAIVIATGVWHIADGYVRSIT